MLKWWDILGWWRAYQTLKKLAEEWKMVTLSRQETVRIDNQLAIALNTIKEDFRKKERDSRVHVLKIQSTTTEV
ncbi:MAG: hypothetical protein ACD_80C00147G0008 [uncultured bacterium (gcode 4)]|uniref:Uncharacterized protein n=1 Tax=uncultured bacterium (gcode 4) TaxID=1234023 RepID=K1YHH8_9BACT|nr:MAG: hypothetical protein ACD_80C00147G0008 [uncultured bacterium (gcode 4)]